MNLTLKRRTLSSTCIGITSLFVAASSVAIPPPIPPENYPINIKPTTAYVCIPDGATRNVSFNIDVLGGLSDPAFSAANEPAGAVVNFATGSGDTQDYVMSVDNLGVNALGTHLVDVTTGSSNWPEDPVVELSLIVYDSNSELLTTAPTLVRPVDSRDYYVGQTLTWQYTDGAEDYLVEVDNDLNFNSIDYQATLRLRETESASSGFTHYPQYYFLPGTWYWRVTANNGCGTALTSAVGQFEAVSSSPGSCVYNPRGSWDMLVMVMLAAGLFYGLESRRKAKVSV